MATIRDKVTPIITDVKIFKGTEFTSTSYRNGFVYCLVLIAIIVLFAISVSSMNKIYTLEKEMEKIHDILNSNFALEMRLDKIDVSYKHLQL